MGVTVAGEEKMGARKTSIQGGGKLSRTHFNYRSVGKIGEATDYTLVDEVTGDL